MFKRLLIATVSAATILNASAHACMHEGTPYYAPCRTANYPSGPVYGSYAPSNGYYPNGYAGGTVINAPAGSKVEYSEGLLSGTKLGVNKSCEKISGGNSVCTKADGTQVLVTKDGRITPM